MDLRGNKIVYIFLFFVDIYELYVMFDWSKDIYFCD